MIDTVRAAQKTLVFGRALWGSLLSGRAAFHFRVGFLARFGRQRQEVAACFLVGEKRLTIDDDGGRAVVVNPAQQAPL